MSKFTLTLAQKRELELAEQTVSQVQLLKRIQCIKMRNKGMKNIIIADLLSKSDQTSSNWFQLYKEGGIERLLQWNYQGKISILTQDNLKRLEERNQEAPFERASEAKAFIKEEFGIDFHLHWVQKILKKKLQFTFKKTRLKPGKSPTEEIQRKFVKWYNNKLEQAQNNKCHILFYDPVHQLHNTINGRCWQKKGRDNTVVLPSNTGRKRITIIGAINPVSYELTSMILEGMVDKEVTKVCLLNIRNAYQDNKEIILIMDNAAYNRAYLVQDYAKELNITIKYLPPYAPNLNLVERMWKFLKSKLKNKYIETFKKFKKWINNFFKNIKKYKSEIKKLITNKIQIIKAV